MSTQSTATHEVIRPGISIGAGNELEPGDLVDASEWEPRLRLLWEQKGAIRPIERARLKRTRGESAPPTDEGDNAPTSESSQSEAEGESAPPSEET